MSDTCPCYRSFCSVCEGGGGGGGGGKEGCAAGGRFPSLTIIGANFLNCISRTKSHTRTTPNSHTHNDIISMTSSLSHNNNPFHETTILCRWRARWPPAATQPMGASSLATQPPSPNILVAIYSTFLANSAVWWFQLFGNQTA